MNKIKYFKMYIIFLVLAMLCNSLDLYIAGDCYFLSKSDTLRPMASVFNTNADLELLTGKKKQEYVVRVDQTIAKIRALLQSVDGKIIKRAQIDADIVKILLNFNRGKKPFFTKVQAKQISRIRKLEDKLNTLNYLILHGDNKDFTFTGSHIAMTLQCARDKTKIEALIRRLHAFNIRNGAHIAKILLSSRDNDEIVRIVKELQSLNIKKGTNIAVIVQGSRKEADIKPLITKLRSHSIENNSHISKILRCSRSKKDIVNTLDKLVSLGLDKSVHAVTILQTSRDDENIEKTVKEIRAIGIENKTLIVSILGSSRDRTELKPIDKILNSFNMKEEAHKAIILKCSRDEIEIESLIRALITLKIQNRAHIAEAFKSSRDEEEMTRIINKLMSLNIKDSLQIVKILQSSRKEIDIERIIKALEDIKIKNPRDITLILRGTHSIEDIGYVVDGLRTLGIDRNIYISLILGCSRNKEDIVKTANKLKSLGIKTPHHITIIIQSARKREELGPFIEKLRSLGIMNNFHLALMLHSSRNQDEIERIIKKLTRLGIEDKGHIAKVICSKRTEKEIIDLAKVLMLCAKENNGYGLPDSLIAKLVANPAYLVEGLEYIYKHKGKLPSFARPLTDKKYIEFRLFLRKLNKKAIFSIIDTLYEKSGKTKTLKAYIKARITEDKDKRDLLQSQQKLSEDDHVTAGLLLFSFDTNIRQQVRDKLVENFAYILDQYHDDDNISIAAETLLRVSAQYNIYHGTMTGDSGPSAFETYLYSSLRFVSLTNHYNSLPESVKRVKQEISAFLKEFKFTYQNPATINDIYLEFTNRGYNIEAIKHALGKESLSLDQSINNGDTPLSHFIPDKVESPSLNNYLYGDDDAYGPEIYAPEAYLLSQEAGAYGQRVDADSYARSSSAGLISGNKDQRNADQADRVLKEIRDAFLTIDGKRVLRKDIKPALKKILLQISRDETPLFSVKQAQKLAKVRKLGDRLETFRYLFLLRSGDSFTFANTDITRMLQSPRALSEIESIIKILASYGINNGAYIKMVTMSAHEDGEIETIIKKLNALKIEGGHTIAKILQSDRDVEEIQRIIKNLRSLGIEEDVYISSILLTSRPEDEIDRLVNKLISIGIKENIQITKLLQSSWKEKEIGGLAETLITYIKKNNGHKLTNAKIAKVLSSPVFLNKGFDHLLNREGRLPSFEEPFTKKDKLYIKFRLFLRDLNKKVIFSIIDTIYGPNEKTVSLRNIINMQISKDTDKLVTLESRRRLFGNDHTITGLLLFSFDADIRKRASAIFVKNYEHVMYKYNNNVGLLSVAGEILAHTVNRYNIYARMLAGEADESKYKTYLDTSLRFAYKRNFYSDLPKSLLPLRRYIRKYIMEFTLTHETEPSELSILYEFSKRGYEEESIMRAMGKSALSLDRAASNSNTPLMDLVPDQIENASLISAYLYDGGAAESTIYQQEAYLLSQEAGIYEQYEDIYAKPSSSGTLSIATTRPKEVVTVDQMLSRIHQLLQSVDGKTVLRKHINPIIVETLLRLSIGERLIFNESQAKKIAKLIKLERRLGIFRYLLLRNVSSDNIFTGSHIASILSTSRDKKEIERIIKTLKALGIEKSTHITTILYTSRKEKEIKDIVKKLYSLKIKNPTHIARILLSSRDEEEIERIVETLRILGIEENTHLSTILQSSRKEKEIKDIINKLYLLGIKDSVHIARALHSSRDEEEIERVIKLLKSLGIIKSSHLTAILQSARKEKEIERIIEMLRAHGIEENTHLSTILQSSRKEKEIKDIINKLYLLGIKDSVHIARALRSSRDEEEIERVIKLLRSLDIKDHGHISMVLRSSRDREEIKRIIKLLISLNIKENSHITTILYTSRKEKEIKDIVKKLYSLKIKNPTHIARILLSSRDEEEIVRIIKTLKALGMKKGVHITLILQSSRTEKEIELLAKILLDSTKDNNGHGFSDALVARLVANTDYLINGLEYIYKRRGELPSFKKPFTEDDEKYIEFRLLLRNIHQKVLFLIIDTLYKDSGKIRTLNSYIAKRVTEDVATLMPFLEKEKLSDQEHVTAGLLLFSFDANVRRKVRDKLIENYADTLSCYHDTDKFSIAAELLLRISTDFNVYHKMLLGEIGESDYRSYLFSSLRFVPVLHYYSAFPESLKRARKEIGIFIREYKLAHGTSPSSAEIDLAFVDRGYDTESIELALGKRPLSLDNTISNSNTSFIDIIPDAIENASLMSAYLYDSGAAEPAIYQQEAYLLSQEAGIYEQYEDIYAKSSSSGLSMPRSQEKALSNSEFNVDILPDKRENPSKSLPRVRELIRANASLKRIASAA